MTRELALLVTLLIPATVGAQSEPAPDRIFGALAVPQGGTICEIGAGDGRLSIEAGNLVGSSGRVYTSELGDARVRTLQEKVAASRLDQITVVSGDPMRTNFPDAGCDGLFMKDVYHHFGEPAAMNASISAALKPGGRLAIVDFKPPPGSEAKVAADRDTDGKHGITPETLSRELHEAGFEAVSSETSGRWFMIVVSKPKP